MLIGFLSDVFELSGSQKTVLVVEAVTSKGVEFFESGRPIIVGNKTLNIEGFDLFSNNFKDCLTGEPRPTTSVGFLIEGLRKAELNNHRGEMILTPEVKKS